MWLNQCFCSTSLHALGITIKSEHCTSISINIFLPFNNHWVEVAGNTRNSSFLEQIILIPRHAKQSPFTDEKGVWSVENQHV